MTINLGGVGFGSIGGIPTLFTNFITALRGQNSGTIQPRVLCVGDSTTFGVGSSAGADLKPNNWVTQLKSDYETGGRTSQSNSFVGGGSNIYEDNLLNDGRVTAGAGWSALNNPTAGGVLFINTTTTNDIAFTPTEDTDTYDVWYVSTPTSGVLRLNVNGGANTDTATLDVADDPKKITITGTLGANTLNISRLSGGAVFIMAVNAYNSSSKTLEVMNAGWPGARSTELNDSANPWSPLNIIPFYEPDLTLLMLGINDWNGLGGAVTAAQYKINMQAVITASIATGDVALCSPVPTRNSVTLLTTQQTYVDKLHELAVENDLAIIDVFADWTSWEVSDPLGRYDDDIHPSASGYSDIADFIYAALPK